MSTILYGINKQDLQNFLLKYYWNEEHESIDYCMDAWKNILGFDIFVTADALQRYIKKYSEKLANMERFKIEAFAYTGDTDNQKDIVNAIAQIISNDIKISVYVIGY